MLLQVKLIERISFSIALIISFSTSLHLRCGSNKAVLLPPIKIRHFFKYISQVCKSQSIFLDFLIMSSLHDVLINMKGKSCRISSISSPQKASHIKIHIFRCSHPKHGGIKGPLLSSKWLYAVTV